MALLRKFTIYWRRSERRVFYSTILVEGLVERAVMKEVAVATLAAWSSDMARQQCPPAGQQCSASWLRTNDRSADRLINKHRPDTGTGVRWQVKHTLPRASNTVAYCCYLYSCVGQRGASIVAEETQRLRLHQSVTFAIQRNGPSTDYRPIRYK